MNFYQATLFLTSFLILFLGLFVFTKNVRAQVNRSFTLLATSLAIWGFGMLALSFARDKTSAISCLHILYLGLVFGPSALLSFVLSVTYDRDRLNHIIAKIGFIGSLVFLLLHVSGKFGFDVIYMFGSYRAAGDMISPYFNTFLCLLGGYSCYLLYKRYKISNSGIEKNRLRYLFLGIFVAVLSTITNILRISGLNVYPLFHIGLLFFSFMTAYAIVRYRLMDITIIIRKALVYSILTFLVTGVWLCNTFLFSKLSVFLLGYQSFFSIIITAFIIAFTFLPVRDKIQSLVDKTFFHQRQELEELIRDFGLTVEFSFDREFILRATVNTVLRIVEVKRISVMIINEAGEYLVSTALGLAPEKWDIKFDASNCVVTWLAKEKRPLLRREVNENPDLRWIRDDLIRELDRIDAVLIIPLISHDRLLGLLNLGRKISEVGFREEEIVLLETLAEAATLAFENIKFFDERVNLVLNTIDALCMAIEAQNKYAKGHAQRVAYYATLVAKELGLDDKTIETVKIASFLHDIGNVGVSEEILNLNRRLTPEEFDKVKLHTLIGVNLIQDINLEKETIECILSHHERLDGSGYPHASKGEAIPISARIVSVVDVYDAMIHDRPYRKAFSQEEALREIRNGKGIKFDPNVVDALIRVLGREGKVKKERNIA